MRITLFVICCCIAGSLAWLAPERCRQGKSRRATKAGQVKKEATTLSAEEIARIQQTRLESNYKNYTFAGVPIRGSCSIGKLEVYSAFDCKFYTYAPRSIASVACTSTDCKLSRSVATVDTYTADEGYNWGVTVSTKVSLGKIFEVGAEASTGGTYSCSYTKGKTTTDTVECAATSSNGDLNLYNVQTDMICEFGTIELIKEKRNYEYGTVSKANAFTNNDLKQIKEYAAKFLSCRFKNNMMVDTSRIPSRLLQKLTKTFPKYDPYTDLLTVTDTVIIVNYYKVNKRENEYEKVVPFTDEGGNSVYQYACVFQPRK